MKNNAMYSNPRNTWTYFPRRMQSKKLKKKKKEKKKKEKETLEFCGSRLTHLPPSYYHKEKADFSYFEVEAPNGINLICSRIERDIFC